MREFSLLTVFILGFLKTPAVAATKSPHQLHESGVQMMNGVATRDHVPLAVRKSTMGQGWTALIDPALGTTRRAWGKAVSAPGSSSSPSAAESFARDYLRRHLQELAPGSQYSDFRLVSNQQSGSVRVVGFAQYRGQLPVIGGQVSFRFKNNKLTMVAGEAYPNVPVFQSQSVWVNKASSRAVLATYYGANVNKLASTGELAILPVISKSGRLNYFPVEIGIAETSSPLGKHKVFWDVRTGNPVASESMLLFADAQIYFDVPDRWPGSSRGPLPAARLRAIVANEVKVTTTDGILDLASTGPFDVTLTPDGELISVATEQGNLAELQISLSDGSVETWDASSDELLDAQLTTYIHANIAKEFVRDNLPADLPFLDEVLPANVNIDSACNAYFDGSSINFFASNDNCENTGRLADVVYHEFGHALHRYGIIPGVGRFDGAFSEGLSDFLAALITEDSGMGRGFRKDNDPLRELSTEFVQPVRWPDDIAGVHYTGLIYGQAMWSLWQTLRNDLGPTTADPLVHKMYIGAVQRASDIPTAYLETLIEDDDDGDLANGTPNVCAISEAFGRHGLRLTYINVPPLGAIESSALGTDIVSSFFGVGANCPNEEIIDVQVEWLVRGSTESDHILAPETSPGEFTANIPQQPNGTTVRYQVEVIYSDGTMLTFPQNPADPWFEYYVGPTVPLYCTSFESIPWSEGWSISDDSGEWQWGSATADIHSDDPGAPHSGSKFIGNDLAQGTEPDRAYEPNILSALESPQIETGNYSNVRLQYWRWLNVEDGFFDQARIRANGNIAWENANSNMGNSSAIHHRDQQWTFHDVPLSPSIQGGPVQVAFELQTDGGLELGGWSIDTVCVVADPNVICGDGIVSAPEECDEGPNNEDVSDNCRTYCRLASCGDGILDSGEGCDDGNNFDDDGCSSTCVADGDTGTDIGCQSGSPALPLLAILTLGLLVRRPTLIRVR